MNLKIWWGKLDHYSKLAFIIIVIGILLRFLVAFFVYVTGDPCWFISVSRYMAENLRIPLFEPLGRPVFWTPPLFQFIAAFFYKVSSIFGKDVANFSVNLVSPIFGSLTLMYLFFFTKKLYNSKIAFYAVIFLAFIPLHLYMSTIPYQDVAVTFFVLASVYYLLDKKAFLSGIFAGLALSTKYTAVFIFPLSLFIIFLKFSKSKKNLIRVLLLFLIAITIFGSWWYVRNHFILGSPFWPHLHSVLGHETNVDPTFLIQDKFEPRIDNLFKIDFIYRIYLSLYGVPGAGNLSNLTFLKLPFLKIFLALWFCGTLLFTLPLLIYLFKIKIRDKRTWILLVWFFSFFSFAIINKITNDLVYIRHSMPLFIPLAVMWGLGLDKLISNRKRVFKLAVAILLVLCVLGFSAVELVKAIVVSNTWSYYEKDFEWVSKNIPEKDVILVPRGDCYAYNFNRYTHGFYDRPYIRSVDKIKIYNVSYIWVNQEIDFYGPDKRNFSAAYPNYFIDLIDNYTLVYHNKKTSTKIYKVE